MRNIRNKVFEYTKVVFEQDIFSIVESTKEIVSRNNQVLNEVTTEQIE